MMVTAVGFVSISSKVGKGHVNAFQLMKVGAYAEGSVQRTIIWSADAACLYRQLDTLGYSCEQAHHC